MAVLAEESRVVRPGARAVAAGRDGAVGHVLLDALAADRGVGQPDRVRHAQLREPLAARQL